MVQFFLTSMHGPGKLSRDPLKPGEFLLFPDGRAWVVESISKGSAHVLPLTPEERTITVRSKADPKVKVTKEINEYGEPLNISLQPLVPRIDLMDLGEVEMRRLGYLLELGVNIPLEGE